MFIDTYSFSFIVYFGKVNGVHMGIVNYLVRILMKRLTGFSLKNIFI